MQRENPFETPVKHYITMYVFMICSNIVPFLFQLTFHKKEECYRHFHLLTQTKRATHSYVKNNLIRNLTKGKKLFLYLNYLLPFSNCLVSFLAFQIDR